MRSKVQSCGTNPEGAAMMHFLNALCATVLIYASVTRGALGVARILERLVKKPA